MAMAFVVFGAATAACCLAVGPLQTSAGVDHLEIPLGDLNDIGQHVRPDHHVALNPPAATISYAPFRGTFTQLWSSHVRPASEHMVSQPQHPLQMPMLQHVPQFPMLSGMATMRTASDPTGQGSFAPVPERPGSSTLDNVLPFFAVLPQPSHSRNPDTFHVPSSATSMPSNTIVSHEARALVYVPVVARTLLAIGDKIGSGTYGSVRRGTRSLCIHSIHGVCLQQNDPVDVAIKRQPKDDSGTSRLVHEVEVLKTLMSRLPHPNVIEILDEFFVNDVHWTVMQYIDGRSLYDHVNQLCAGMPESDARAIWARVLDGLGFLHSQNIYHSDLNPKNIVLDANGCPKIIDFSLSKVSRSGLVVSRCTEPFEAPEAGWDVQPYRGDKADIWSAGAILFWMIFFQHAQPFPAGLTYDIWKTVCRNYPVRFPASPDTTKQVRNLLSSVLDIDPDARPGTAEIGRQTWMTMPL